MTTQSDFRKALNEADQEVVPLYRLQQDVVRAIKVFLRQERQVRNNVHDDRRKVYPFATWDPESFLPNGKPNPRPMTNKWVTREIGPSGMHGKLKILHWNRRRHVFLLEVEWYFDLGQNNQYQQKAVYNVDVREEDLVMVGIRFVGVSDRPLRLGAFNG